VALGESRRFNDGKGALSVRAICTHAILSGGAYEKIENSQLLELVTDSIPLKNNQTR
jgi:ribose-phosphate pyrophosphokinase